MLHISDNNFHILVSFHKLKKINTMRKQRSYMTNGIFLTCYGSHFSKWLLNACYVPLCPPFRYVRKQILSFCCVRMRTQRNGWYVPLCPLFRYVRDGFSSFRCVRMRTQRNDWYVPLCPPFRYVRKQILSFRCVRMCIYTHM